MKYLLTLLLVLTPRLAIADAELDALLDRWADALGGRELLAEPTVLEQRLVGTAFGLDAVAWSRTTLDGRIRLEINLGGGLYTFVQIYDGEQGWQIDQNGKLSPFEGADLRTLITTAYIDRNLQLLDASRGSRKLLEPGEDGPRIRCTPTGGDPVTFVLDPETGLPLRFETPSQERVQTTTIHRWDTHHGLLLPAVIDQGTGDPQYDVHLELQEANFHGEIDPAWFTPPTEEQDDVLWTTASPLRDIPIELNTVHVFVQCSVNGSDPLWFALDTGASITVLNKRSAEELGLKLEGSIEGRGVGESTTEVQLAGNVSYGLPGVELQNQTVATIDLDRIEALMGRRLDGILGFDFISRFVVEVDYAGQRLHLHDRKGWEYQGDGVILETPMEGSQPHVEAELILEGREPVRGLFLIDSGANSSIHFTKPFAEKHDLAAALPNSVQASGGFGVGGRSKSTVARAPEFRLGGIRFHNPVVALSQDESGAHANPNLAGLIGGHVLERCRVFFDYERTRMILEPHEGMNAPFTTDSLGMIGTTRGREDFHSYSVMEVLPGMAAEKAGLRAGDEILEFDGTPMAEFDYQKMWERVQQSNDRIVVRIRRDGQQRDVEVQLRPMI